MKEEETITLVEYMSWLHSEGKTVEEVAEELKVLLAGVRVVVGGPAPDDTEEEA